MRKNSVSPFLCLAGFLLSGCISLTNTAGRILDGRAFEGKTLAVYRAEAKDGAGSGGKKRGGPETEIKLREGKDGREYLEIFPGAFPNLSLRGSAPDGEGNFYLSSLRFLSGHVSGWTEFTLDLSGTGRFILRDSAARFALLPPIEPVQISAGEIRRNTERISGDRALRVLRNRYERILALTEWMRTRDPPGFSTITAFESYWKPQLLPELVSEKKRPAAWDAGGAVWVRAEDVRWNTQYTLTLFPESLWELRNSGALLRDWEEALPWIYFEYERERLMESFQGELEFIKIK